MRVDVRRKNKEAPTLELIEAKSIDDGGCWIWDQGTAHGNAYMSVNGKSVAVRRWIMQNKGIDIRGKLVTSTCMNSLCVNPEHLIVVTRAKLQKMWADHLQYASNPVRCAKLAAHARARVGASPEEVLKARTDPRSIRVVAAELGRSYDFVQAVRAGESWKTYSSPWAGLGSR
jgi:hypothetical protein